MKKPTPSEKTILKDKVSTQAKTIKQLLGEIEDLKVKVTSYMESAFMYKCENEDLRVRCEEVEELLRQTETSIEIENKANKEHIEEIEKYQKTIEELQNAKKLEMDRSHEYFCALLSKQAECRKLKAELEEARKPWYKKLFMGV